MPGASFAAAARADPSLFVSFAPHFDIAPSVLAPLTFGPCDFVAVKETLWRPPRIMVKTDFPGVGASTGCFMPRIEGRCGKKAGDRHVAPRARLWFEALEDRSAGTPSVVGASSQKRGTQIQASS